MAEKRKSRWIRQEYLDRTRHFYEKYGGKTVFLGKFLPIIRTFAPFVAGIGSMTYPRFLFFNITGALTWVFVFVLLLQEQVKLAVQGGLAPGNTQGLDVGA